MQSRRLQLSCPAEAALCFSRRSIRPARQQIDLQVRAVATQARPSQQVSLATQHAVLEARAASGSSAGLLDAPQQPATASESRRSIILLNGDSLESTVEHRRIVGIGLALMGGLFAVGAAQVHDAPTAAAAAAAAASAYATAGEYSCTGGHAAHMSPQHGVHSRTAAVEGMCRLSFAFKRRMCRCAT